MPRSSASPPKRNHLDQLRLLFAALVLLSHAPELVDGDRSRELFSQLTGNVESFGGFAVSGFFSLSGYLIMASWQRHPDLATYFRNRILRIYPGFVIAFCISVLVVGPLAAGGTPYFEHFDRSRFLFALVTLREPWFATSFPGQHHTGVNGALWTISYEFACYVAVAFIAVLAGRRLKPLWLALTVLLLVATFFLPELEPLPPVSRFLVAPLVKMSAIFFAGASLCLLGFERLRGSGRIAAVGLLFAATWFSPRLEVAGFAVFGTLFFLSIGNIPARSTSRHWPDISYGTYLYGWPILQSLIWIFPDRGPGPIFVMSLALALACGYLSWTFVEAPFLRMKSRPARASVDAT